MVVVEDDDDNYEGVGVTSAGSMDSLTCFRMREGGNNEK